MVIAGARCAAAGVPAPPPHPRVERVPHPPVLRPDERVILGSGAVGQADMTSAQRITAATGADRTGTRRPTATAERRHILKDKSINSGDGPQTAEERANSDFIRVSGTGMGTSAEYLTRRLVRDHPDIAERMRAGEYRSVRAAALDAGIVRRKISVDAADAASAVRSLRAHMDPDVLAELRRLLS